MIAMLSGPIPTPSSSALDTPARWRSARQGHPPSRLSTSPASPHPSWIASPRPSGRCSPPAQYTGLPRSRRGAQRLHAGRLWGRHPTAVSRAGTDKQPAHPEERSAVQVRYSEDSSDGGEFENTGTGGTPSAARIAAGRVWSRLTELRIRFDSTAAAKRPQRFNEA